MKMNNRKINIDKIYQKAKQIQTNLLLFVDKEIKKKTKNDINKRYIKNCNISNNDSFQITFQEYFNNNIRKSIRIFSNQEKSKIESSGTSFIFQSGCKTLTSISSNSSLSTQEISNKKIQPISKKISHEKVIPENLMNLIEKKRKRKISIFLYINNISNNDSLINDLSINNNDEKGEEEKYIKHQKYLEDLCNIYKNSFI